MSRVSGRSALIENVLKTFYLDESAVLRVCLQLEDAELATAAAVKARKAMEMELQDLQSQFEALSKSKQEVAMCGLDICLETS